MVRPVPAALPMSIRRTARAPARPNIWPRFDGVLQVDGYAGFKRLAGDRADGSVRLAFCWAHMRRPFYQFHASTKSPLAAEVLARIAALYAIEAEIRGHPAEHRRQVRQQRSRPIVEALHGWLQDQLAACLRCSDLAKAMRYAIRHWPGLVAFLDDGRIEMDTNVVERAIRPQTLTRKNALFAGSDGGARHWAIAMTLIQTAKLNGVEPMAWLTDVLERIVSGRTKIHELHTLLPWNWQRRRTHAAPNFARGGMIDHPEQAERLTGEAEGGSADRRAGDARSRRRSCARAPRRRSRRTAQSPGSATRVTKAASSAGSTSAMTHRERPLRRSHTCASIPACRCPGNHRLSETSRQTPPAPAPVAVSRGLLSSRQ